jgi:hypothetical protein
MRRVIRYTGRVERYELQAIARQLLPQERIRSCLRAAATVPHVKYSPARKSAHLGGLMVCGSPWACPVCATRISERRRGEVERAASWVKGQGLQLVLSTFTLSHGSSHALSASLEALNGAYRRMLQRRDYKALRVSYGLTHSIKAVEVTWGADSGFHPHLHVLQVVHAGTDAVQLGRDLAAAWLPSLRAHGFGASAAHGVDVRATWGAVQDYVSKMGRTWGAPEELTKANSKTGRGDRFTPWDLLRSVRDAGDQLHGSRFREFALTMKGTRQLRWSPGFRSLVGLAAERSDAELAANWLDDDTLAYTLVWLDSADWAAVRYFGPEALAQVEAAGDTGDRAKVAAVVAEYRGRYFVEGWGL